MAGGLEPNSLGVLSELLGGVLNGDTTLSLRFMLKLSVDMLGFANKVVEIFGLPVRFTGGGPLPVVGLLLDCGSALDGRSESGGVTAVSCDVLTVVLFGEVPGEDGRTPR